ncbi:ribonuclease E/G [Aureibaculum algae]|uniref:Ribonuclease E/G n=2 Tax=Aureibaculum TaxID=2706948 RepID=A0A5B7TYQ5_9FLAO|nr:MULTISPECIES: ribonuclease E/G [Aureibaculum]MBJ2174752.1 ribonuclease E/G [Aureibaculum flavum]QCX40504.1 ribonuclease E/G [Aureibaculum algae]
MKTELIIRSTSSDIDFALLKDGRLNELHKETNDNNFNVGDIFLAKIKKTLSGLNAAFVNVGSEKDAFLHYHDLGPQLLSLTKYIKLIGTGKLKDYTLKDFHLEKDINKNGSIDQVIKSGQNLLVQVVKEPISTKGPRISSELSIAGRYLVLVPFSDRVSVSQKISNNKEKERLKRLAKSIKPKGFGVILRTVAEGIKVAELDKDLQNSLQRWVNLCKHLPRAQAPAKVLSELNRASSILRDIFDDSFSSIVTDDAQLFEELKEYIERIAPTKVSMIKLYKSKLPIFEKYGIEKQIKTAFGRTVSMPKGAYLVIEHTEALHVIDVNSGNRSNKANSQADTALEVNLIAASEIARQLQLRDMGGIIVVDFIDMHTASHRQKLFDHLKNEMKSNRTKHKILPPSKFGLVQITRQRVRPEMVIKTQEKNPNINGEVEAPIILVDKIENHLGRIIDKSKKGLTLHAHSFVESYLKKGMPSIQQKWFFKYKKWIKVIPRDAYQYLEYHFFDKDDNEIK